MIILKSHVSYQITVAVYAHEEVSVNPKSGIWLEVQHLNKMVLWEFPTTIDRTLNVLFLGMFYTFQEQSVH